MNELALAHTLDVAMWVFGGLFAVLSLLVGIIRAQNQRRDDEVRAKLLWIEGNYVRSETLDRVERTWCDALEAMTEQRKEMHAENKEGIREIKDSIARIHERIDEEFRTQRVQR